MRLGDVLGRPYSPNLGDTEGALGSYRKAQALMERALALRPGESANQDELLQSYMKISRILERQKKIAEEMEILQRAIRIAEALRKHDPKELIYTEELALVTQYLGQVQYQMAEKEKSVTGFQQALETYQKALAIQQSVGPQASESWRRGLATRYQYIGYALFALGEWTGDASHYKKALDAVFKGSEISRNLAESHTRQPDATITRVLADELQLIGLLRWKCCRDLTGSLRDLHESLQTFEMLSAADPQNLEGRRDIADVHNRIGEVLTEAGRSREAMGANLRALIRYEELARVDPSSMENASYIAKVRSRIVELQGHK